MPIQSSTRWTDEECEKLRGLVSDGLTASKIAKSLGKSRSAVLGRAMRMKLKLASIAPTKGKPTAKQSLHAGNIARKKASRAFDPGFEPVSVATTTFECRSVPLSELRAGECKWPVNEAPTPADHLFCGNKANRGTYCHAHWARSLGIGTVGERRAMQELDRVAA